jgi:hypothetical protein
MPTFVLKLGVCVDCRNSLFTLSDETGEYNAVTNDSGWNNSSVALTSVDSAWLQVTAPSGNVYGPYDILATFPNIDGTTLQIDPEDIMGSGEGEAMSDGRWFFEYGVQGDYTSSQVCVLTEVLANPTFSSGASWTLTSYGNANGAISGGLLRYDDITAPGAAGTLSALQSNVLTIGVQYLITIDITTNSNCFVRIVEFGSWLNYQLAIPGQTGVVTVYYTPTTSTDLSVWISGVGAGLTHTCRITSVSAQSNICTGGVVVPYNYRCTQEVLVDCEVACCVIQKTADADSCACKGSASRAKYDHHLNYVSMWGAWNCGKKEKALKLLEKLQAMCAGNCKDC